MKNKFEDDPSYLLYEKMSIKKAEESSIKDNKIDSYYIYMLIFCVLIFIDYIAHKINLPSAEPFEFVVGFSISTLALIVLFWEKYYKTGITFLIIGVIFVLDLI